MNAFNEFFKNLADKMNLPDFFKGNTLIFNNLFLVLFTAICLIALLLVIFLVPGKKKKAAKAAAKAAAESAKQASTEPPVEEAEAPTVEQAEEAPAEEAEAPTVEQAEEAPAEEVPVEEVPVEEAAVEDVAEEAAPAPSEERAEESAEQVAEQSPVEEDESAPAEDDKAQEEEKIKNGGKYEIVKRNGEFFFLLKANNGQLLLESSGYTTLAGAKKAIDTFKNAVEVGEFSIDEDKNGNFKFVLRASARSQMRYFGESYSSRQSAENAVLSVKNFAFKSVIKRMEENDEEDASASAIPVETAPLKEEDRKMGGKYEIEEREGNFYFLLKANNGQLLLESPAFTSAQGAKSGIETFKKAADTGIFVIDKDKNDNFRFILRANARAQTRYFGESYSTRQSAENSVHSVRAFAENAVLK